MRSPVVHITDAHRGRGATGRTPVHTPASETDPSEQLAHDLLALVRCGLVELQHDRAGSWRAALASTIDR
ncbi:MAG TPA: hypothetical protein VGO80_01655 [Solirubrobacteraceae bacterium]|jgi:hypothetical protein|nr:hypothetical protein [Solirubrobacteraceae bacterium]